jgi:hypothetical protein
MNATHIRLSFKQHAVIAISIVPLPLSECVAVCANYGQLANHRGRFGIPTAQALPHDMLSSTNQRYLAPVLYQTTRIRSRVSEDETHAFESCWPLQV